MNAPTSPASRESGPNLPWWRVGMVWFALAGPALVVVAGIVTAGIAVHGADTVLRVAPDVAATQAPASRPATTPPPAGSGSATWTRPTSRFAH